MNVPAALAVIAVLFALAASLALLTGGLPTTLPAALAWLAAIIALPINVYVTVKLWRLVARSPKILVLRERALVATALLVIVAVFTATFLNNDQIPPYLTTDVTKLITRAVVLAMSVAPAVYWLRLYRAGRTTTDADDATRKHPDD